MDKMIAKNASRFGERIAQQISDYTAECCTMFARDSYETLVDVQGPVLYDRYIAYARANALPEWKKGVFMAYFKYYTGDPVSKKVGNNKNATRVYSIMKEHIDKFTEEVKDEVAE